MYISSILSQLRYICMVCLMPEGRGGQQKPAFRSIYSADAITSVLLAFIERRLQLKLVLLIH